MLGRTTKKENVFKIHNAKKEHKNGINSKTKT